MTAADRKADLRRFALARRRMVTPEARQRARHALRSLAMLIENASGRPAIGGFMPFGGELDPLPLMARLARRGFRVGIPRVVAKNEALAFHRWSPGDVCRRGAFGIREPSPARAPLDPDIFLVPLAAFDRRGYRIGYGGGFYDRTLEAAARARSILTIGIGYSVQEIAQVPAEPHDVALDAILTERGLQGEF
ncbi:MAG: 5-formyltetrahydrofolate cyclo-ligase [Flavobacteriaceae bacterium]